MALSDIAYRATKLEHAYAKMAEAAEAWRQYGSHLESCPECAPPSVTLCAQASVLSARAETLRADAVALEAQGRVDA